jgi:ubiquinone/menaquinone biosynthesis C-methylase UbiE
MDNFWKTQAIQFGSDSKAVNFDLLEEQLEFKELEKLVEGFESIGDLGCGNGRATLFLAEKFPNIKFVGLDFIPEMIEIANIEKDKKGLKNVEFYVADFSQENLNQQFNYSFDFVFTKRLLINLIGSAKYNGLENVISMLKTGGKYAMIECFIEPLNRINEIRINLNLTKIEVNFFNEYLTDSFLELSKEKLSFIETIDFESFYYFNSRILNAALTEGKPDYLAPINKLSVELLNNSLAPQFKGYCPEVIHVFTKN